MEPTAKPHQFRAVLTARPDEDNIARRLKDVAGGFDAAEYRPQSDPYSTLSLVSNDPAVDVVITDGHGIPDLRHRPVFDGIAFAPESIRLPNGRGIGVPVWVLGCCYGASPRYLDAVRRSMDRPQLAFLAGEHPTDFEDADKVFPLVLKELAKLGAAVRDPKAAYEVLEGLAYPAEAGWTAHLLCASTSAAGQPSV